MEPTLPPALHATLLGHATAAARLVGHLDDPAAGPLADHIDAIVHHLTELLGDPRALNAAGAAAADDRAAHTGARMLTLAAPAEEMCEPRLAIDHEDGPRRLKPLAHPIGAAVSMRLAASDDRVACDGALVLAISAGRAR